MSKNSGDITVETKRGVWKCKSESLDRMIWKLDDRINYFYFLYFIGEAQQLDSSKLPDVFIPIHGSSQLKQLDLTRISTLANAVWNRAITGARPQANAPVRSRPRRTYDPLPPERDPEGDYIPMYFSSLAIAEPTIWKNLKHELQSFGKSSGLFDELSIRHLGHKRIEPFQIQVRRFGSKHKGPMRNIIDVGYGVSQVLPLITELLQTDSESMFLIQQPEVHLHPTAQAALGSLFCQIANWKQQLIVETHSDYIVDRIRMDVRDKKSNLNAEDVSILYFERDDLDSKIHCLRLDEYGNILSAPDSYRRFFMRETRRSLGI
ncbi:MAG: AAA family ATPase [Bryobacterales bacterium]|nr:AAA family ATPase [Bryobacterales bacterium]